MSGLKAYMELLESGSHTKLPAVVGHPKRALIDLLTAAKGQTLDADSPWILAAKHARRLEQQTGYRPPGGWPAVAASMAAAHFMDVDSNGFAAVVSVEDAQALDATEVRRQCLEGFTRWLAPPAAAAGFFVCLGLHPMWGLRMVQAIESPFCNQMPMRDESVLPSTTLALVNQTVFGALAVVFAALRTLDTEMIYPVDALVPLIVEACLCARQITGDIQTDERNLPVFIADTDDSGAAFRRVADVAVLDLLDTVLVPAGAATRAGSGGFQMMEGALDGVRVGNFTPIEQESWLGWLTSVEPRFFVA